MSISADRAADQDRLGRTLELYRDLTVALRGRITLLEAGTCDDGQCAAAQAALHRKALQTVLDIEAGLAKRTGSTDGRASVELDLDAARAEIVARLAVWVAGR